MLFRRLVENKVFRDFLLIFGVFTTGIGLLFSAQQTHYNAQQIQYSAQQNLEAAHQLDLTKQINSAQLVDTIMQRLNDPKYDKLVNAIESDGDEPLSHSSTFPIWKSEKHGGQFTYKEITDYINNFDEVGNLYEEGLINRAMAYREFSYDAEKAYCNNDIQSLIKSDRQYDGNLTGDKASWWGFTQLTESFLQTDNKQCFDLDKE